MDAIKDMLSQNFAAVIIGLFFIMAGFNKAVDIIGDFSKTIGKPFKWVKKRDEKRNADHELLVQTASKLKTLEGKHKDDTAEIHQEIKDFMVEIKGQMQRYDDNRVSDRAQSFKIQKELVDAQKEISKSVDGIAKRVKSSEEKQNKRVQAEIKNQISQLYQTYSQTKTIARTQLEALEDLIETYEEHGGVNSFVHTKVQAEMYAWKVIEG